VVLLISFGPADLPRLDEIAIYWQVIVFNLGVSLLCGFLVGLTPAWQTSAPVLNHTLKTEGSVTTGGFDRASVRRVLAGAQLGLSVVLLVGAGLMLRSLMQLVGVYPGFNADRLLTMHVFVAPSVAREEYQRVELHQRLIDRFMALPEVVAAGTISNPPLSARGDAAVGLELESRVQSAFDEKPQASYRPVSAGYFEAMGIPVLRGRSFGAQDQIAMPGVAVINDVLARRLWRDEDPIGKRIRPDGQDNWLSIIGITGNVHHDGLDTPPRPEVYVPYSQEPGRSFTMVLRTSRDPLTVAASVRRAVSDVHPELPVSRFQAMDATVSASVAWPRLTTVLLSVFAGLALLLAVVGVYATVSHSVAQRTREVGIRLALGAQGRDIFALIMKQELVPVAAGIGFGLIASLLLTRVIESLLFGVSARDPATLGIVLLLLAAAAVLACYVPARRAMRADPLVALRSD
jgi:putative ABC transport system permease protein